ncbi:AraC family transcriptional regulator [Mucilaginibacter flavidus]|uniref:AraC family transcriptional regulator n=1 Tax=Mucilaginibacter flavidus TaxID=2949309 RepID=UPI0020936F5D|nr:AraC family transcriptional regulator [Mucilaginibacter flavidus]MCO5946881.1 AraC family transcriptional regulator [Mucilaginibacter flavidus]
MKKEQVSYRKIFDSEIFEGALSSHIYPWHFHDTYTVIIIDSGAMKYVFRDDEVVVNAGQVFIINAFAAHYNGVLNDIDCNYRVMFLPVRLFNLKEDVKRFTYFDKSVSAKGYRPIGALYEKLKTVGREAAYITITKKITGELLTGLEHKTGSLVLNDRVEAAVLYIHQHIDEKLTIAQLADACNISHFHFQRVFKLATGLTVNAYIQQCRMERSRELLREGIKPVATSLESGFFDHSHFHKQFKKMYALTPAHLVK